ISLAREAENPWYEVTLHEGRNRQIRRMFEQVGHRVEKIKRIRYGSLELDIEPSRYRFLSPAEVAKLRNSLQTRPSPKTAISKAAAETNFYPDNESSELRQALAERHHLPQEQILVTGGSTQLIDIICRTLLAAGLNAVTSERSFIVYPMMARAAGGQIIQAP